ncbi:MAG TPA: CaiB/BaiF CoA-transferase family protein [Terriglobales bacterium]|nr:CaiB/BaiF CoA-transferase family protein [Terriglobales bacterium]
MLPLSGLRVLAIEQAVAAPYCSRQLADLGADVIKVERPDGGDFARDYDGALNGLSAYFAWLNRGKRSIALDLKTPAGLRALQTLVHRADIFVHNLAPGAVERLGCGYDDLLPTCPALIWCGITGYGPDGPYRDRKAYDLLVQAEAGVIAMTGSPAAPAKAGVSIADIAAGGFAYSSILAALLARARHGKGDRIDISMLESLIEWMTPTLYHFHGTGQVPARAGVRHHMVVPYGAYACADGQVLLSVQNDREWRRFCDRVLDLPALADNPDFQTNAARVARRAELETLIERQFSSRTVAEVVALLEAAELPSASLNDVAAVWNHAQLAARDRRRSVPSPAGPIPALLPPHNIKGAPPRMAAVPALGEHTAEIMAEFGIEP